MYINLGAIKFNVASMIERTPHKKLAKVQALEVEYCLVARKVIIQITNMITGKNNPLADRLTKLKNSYNPTVSFPVGVA